MSQQKMITREVVGSVTLMREDGKRHELTTGQKFDFTEEEVRQINAADPKALSATSIVSLDDEASALKVDDQAPAKANQTAAPTAKGAAAKKGNAGNNEEM